MPSLTTRMIGALTGAALVVALGLAPSVPVQAEVAMVETTLSDAREPSVSNDGRWAVFGGTVADGRRSVFRVDLETSTVVEMSPVPEHARVGDSIRPQISADGCVIVAATEVPFDLFRDNDRGERWDIYRLVVPECGGQPNAWELVSSTDGGTARDGVGIDTAPTLSGSGAVVAYTHQADRSTTPLLTISVVDITVPINEPGRVAVVAGMPAELPNRAYTYQGAFHPVLSQNGRHLAFVSDATASDALPGWAAGPIQGGAATTQVYVWDRGATDQRRAVRLVSGVDGVASVDGAGFPDMSEDGRIIAFQSADRLLVPAVLPRCDAACPTQIYRFDRDVDGNGIFDEPPRSPNLALVSAIDAGIGVVGLPQAGDQSSWGASVNSDGSQVAFVTDATNLLPSRRAGGGDALDGDLLVAEMTLGQIRRVLDGQDMTNVPGAHGHPTLSQTGQVLLFDTMASVAIADAEAVTSAVGRNIVVVRTRPQLALAALDFGSVLLGFESTELFATVQNAGPAAFEPSEVFSSSPNFTVTGGTCSPGVIVAAGASCSVKLTFSPTLQQGYEAVLTVQGRGADAASVTTVLRGAAGDPTLIANPGGVDFDAGIVGDVAGRTAIDITNVGFLPTSVARLTIGGLHPGDFSIVTESCTGRALNSEAACAIELEFQPTAVGYRSALVIATTPIGQYTAAVVGGYARYEPSFGIEADMVRAGTDFGVGGNGFPANAEVTLGFDDGSDPIGTVLANADGRFLAVLPMPALVRPGTRRLVATAGGGAVAVTMVTIESRPVRAMPLVPGYGLG